MPCLSITELDVSFSISGKKARAVRGVSLDVGDKRTLGIVGESGCGKSVTALSVMRLLPQSATINSGKILFEGQDLLSLDDRKMRGVRGKRIGMVFQDPMTSLNPVFTCGNQVAEAMILHLSLTKKEAADLCFEKFEQVGINEPRRVYSSYPHELSGGMRQRVMIAMALSCNPKLLIADEPTTALDVTVQAKILELLKNLQNNNDMSMIMITHNLGIVRHLAHDVIVMYAGLVVESAPAEKIFAAPLHPYTECLMKTIPSVEKKGERLTVIPGNVPTPLDNVQGCPFNPRCPRATAACKKETPALLDTGDGHWVRCKRDA